MANFVLNAHVANETVKAVSGNSACGCVKTKKEQREQDRLDMWAGFAFGAMLGIGYLLAPAGMDGIVDFFYVLFYIICQMPVACLHWDSEQPVKTIKTSLVLSSILAVVMLVPFALDADDTASFVMLSIFCLAETLYPLYHLYKMK